MTDPFTRDLLAMRNALLRNAKKLTRNDADAEDLAQEALVKAWAARSKFQPGTNLWGWVGMIMRNQFLSQLRRARRFEGGSIEDLPIECVPSAWGNQESTIDLNDASDALDRIPPEQSYLVVRAGLGFTIEEMADDAGCPVGTVKSRVARGRRAVAKAFA